MTPNPNIPTKFQQIAQRPPHDREIFLDDGSLWVYRGIFPTGTWEDLGPGNEPNVVESAALHFELQNGIEVYGSPGFVLRLVLRAFYRVKADESKELVDFIFRVFKECGWSGPTMSDNVAVPGTVFVELPDFTTKIQEADDLRPVLSQLHNPEFNGWLNFQVTTTYAPRKELFINILKAMSVTVAPSGGKS